MRWAPSATREGRRAGKVFRRIDDHPARAQQQRLEDHRRDRFAALAQRVAEGVDARDPALRVRLPRRAPVAVRRGDTAGGEQDRPERAQERLHAADAHAPGGVPVVPVIEADESGPLLPPEVAPALQRHLERHLHRRGAVVREEDAGQPLRGDRGEPRGQAHRGLVGDPGEQDVVQPLHLPRHRLPDPRVTVPVDDAPPARDGVVIPVPFRVDEEEPLRAVDQHRRFRHEGAHLGVRMPAVPKVLPEQIFPVHQVDLHRSRNARPTGSNASAPRAGSDRKGTSPRTGARRDLRHDPRIVGEHLRRRPVPFARKAVEDEPQQRDPAAAHRLHGEQHVVHAAEPVRRHHEDGKADPRDEVAGQQFLRERNEEAARPLDQHGVVGLREPAVRRLDHGRVHPPPLARRREVRGGGEGEPVRAPVRQRRFRRGAGVSHQATVDVDVRRTVRHARLDPLLRRHAHPPRPEEAGQQAAHHRLPDAGAGTGDEDPLHPVPPPGITPRQRKTWYVVLIPPSRSRYASSTRASFPGAPRLPRPASARPRVPDAPQQVRQGRKFLMVPPLDDVPPRERGGKRVGDLFPGVEHGGGDPLPVVRPPPERRRAQGGVQLRVRLRAEEGEGEQPAAREEGRHPRQRAGKGEKPLEDGVGGDEVVAPRGDLLRVGHGEADARVVDPPLRDAHHRLRDVHPEHGRAAEGVEEHPRVEPRPAAGLEDLERPPPARGPAPATPPCTPAGRRRRAAARARALRTGPRRPRSGEGRRGQPSTTTARNPSARKAACAAPGSG